MISNVILSFTRYLAASQKLSSENKTKKKFCNIYHGNNGNAKLEHPGKKKKNQRIKRVHLHYPKLSVLCGRLRTSQARYLCGLCLPPPRGLARRPGKARGLSDLYHKPSFLLSSMSCTGSFEFVSDCNCLLFIIHIFYILLITIICITIIINISLVIVAIIIIITIIV